MNLDYCAQITVTPPQQTRPFTLDDRKRRMRMWTTISSRMNARASHLLRHRHASDQLGRGRTSQALVVRPAKETHLLGPSLSPKCAVGKVPQLLRLAGPVSLMTFRLRSGTRVDAVTFAAVVPGARRDGGNHHDREQQEPFSINILHVFPFTRFDIWSCLIAQLAGFRLSLRAAIWPAGAAPMSSPPSVRPGGCTFGKPGPPCDCIITRSAAPRGPAACRRAQ